MSAYDKLNMNPYVPAAPSCPASGCPTDNTQFANLSVPVMVTPRVVTGTTTTECCGEPVICCRGESTCSSCELTVTQRIRINIPITFDVDVTTGEAEIDCGCGCQSDT